MLMSLSKVSRKRILSLLHSWLPPSIGCHCTVMLRDDFECVVFGELLLCSFDDEKDNLELDFHFEEAIMKEDLKKCRMITIVRISRTLNMIYFPYFDKTSHNSWK